MKNNKILYGVLALLFVVLIAVAAVFYDDLSQKYQEAPVASQPQEGQSGQSQAVPALDFTVVDADGNQVSLSDFKGKPVVLNFWASWCGPCKMEMPEFDRAFAEYGDTVQFMMVNLTDNFQETLESAKAFLASVDYAFPVYFDTGMEGGIAYGVTAIPATYFIDAQGNVVARAVQSLSYDMLLQGIGMITEE